MYASGRRPGPLVEARLGEGNVLLTDVILAPTRSAAGGRRLSRRVFDCVPGAPCSVRGVPSALAVAESKAFWRRWLDSLGDRQSELRCVAGPGVGHLLSLLPQPATAISVVADPASVALAIALSIIERPSRALDTSRGLATTVMDIFGALANGDSARGIAPDEALSLFNWQSRTLLAGHHDIDDLGLTAGPPPDADVWRQRLHDVVDRHYTLGPFEHLDTFSALLQRKFGWWTADVMSAQEARPSMTTAFTGDVRAFVRECNWLDAELHEALVRRFQPGRNHRDPRLRGRGRTEIYVGDRRAPHPPLVFQHIEKTAGTTFRDLLRRNLAGLVRHDVLAYEDETGSPSRWFEAWFGQLSSTERKRIVCVAGHRAAYVLPFLPSAHAMCVLRDPVERVLSRWWFSGRREDDTPPDPNRLLSWPLEEVYERLGGGRRDTSPMHARAEQFFNDQARVLMMPFHDLGELPYSRGPGADAELWRERAFEALDGYAIAGATERFDALVAYMAQLYGWEVTTPGQHKRNEGRPRGDEVPEELRALIREYNWLDAELHARVMAHWEAPATVPSP